jgi:hypothetical protein
MKLDKVTVKKKYTATAMKPPKKIGNVSGAFYIFLAGSTEMGKAEDWQTKVEKALEAAMGDLETDVISLNPRRDDWDSSWKQTIADKNFLGQVQWEHDGLSKADLIFLYFDPETKSPISMMELGLFAATKNIIVVCPDGFWRKGNIEFICKQYEIPLYNTLQDGIDVMLTDYIN